MCLIAQQQAVRPEVLLGFPHQRSPRISGRVPQRQGPILSRRDYMPKRRVRSSACQDPVPARALHCQALRISGQQKTSSCFACCCKSLAISDLAPLQQILVTRVLVRAKLGLTCLIQVLQVSGSMGIQLGGVRGCCMATLQTSVSKINCLCSRTGFRFNCRPMLFQKRHRLGLSETQGVASRLHSKHWPLSAITAKTFTPWHSCIHLDRWVGTGKFRCSA